MAGQSRYLSFYGRRVHFRAFEPDGDTRYRIFMLSSPLSSTFNWRKLIPELSSLGCRIVLMDLPGFGDGDCGADFPQSDEIRANMAWGVLDTMDMEAGEELSLWHLMGHGLACPTIIQMANAYPDSVRSQIHVSPTLLSALLPPARKPNARAPERWFDKNIASQEGFSRYIDALFARPAEDYVRDHMRLTLNRVGMRGSFARMFAQEEKASPSRGFAPIMLLRGGRDALIDEETDSAYARLLPEAERHVLRTAGHFPMETHSKAMRDYLRGWLKYIG